MSPEKQQLAIAEACGWSRCRESNPCGGWHDYSKSAKPFQQRPPDYLHNRDAIMEAVLELDGTEKKGADGFLWSPRCEFLRQLEIVVSRNHPELKERIQFALVTATAEELCEAYLRARGEWRETTYYRPNAWTPRN